MINLISRLFDSSQIPSVIKLWQDQNSRLLIEKEIGKNLLSSSDILDSSFSQLLILTSLSPFASSENEKAEVAGIIFWGIKHNDILPLVTEHQNKELAYRCLISLGFFRKALEERCNRYGAPSPDFYRTIGIGAFSRNKMEDIGEHFFKWENFINEIFL